LGDSLPALKRPWGFPCYVPLFNDSKIRERDFAEKIRDKMR
jgi:hypothetical protein